MNRRPKAKTIGKYLGKNYIVEASMGHVRDLPKSRLGVDIDNNYTPKYITIKEKGELIDKLRKAAKKADKVYLATDPDREGEAISWHLANILKISEDETCRIVFNEVTKTAVKASIKEARKIDLAGPRWIQISALFLQFPPPAFGKRDCVSVFNQLIVMSSYSIIDATMRTAYRTGL